jgi:2-succinyl-5-enolpyruvyl-6-hydroxy-3-cyclohexene-1-carboxylate synthase
MASSRGGIPRGEPGGDDHRLAPPREEAIYNPRDEDLYTRHVATPTGLDFADAARLYGLRHVQVADVPTFREALERELAATGSGIVEVRGEREENVALHRRVWEAVAGALDGGA